MKNDILKDMSNEIFTSNNNIDSLVVDDSVNNTEELKEELPDIDDSKDNLSLNDINNNIDDNVLDLDNDDSLNDINKIIDENIINNDEIDESDMDILLDDEDEEDVTFNDLNERSEQLIEENNVTDDNENNEVSEEVVIVSNFPKLDKFGSVLPRK